MKWVDLSDPFLGGDMFQDALISDTSFMTVTVNGCVGDTVCGIQRYVGRQLRTKAAGN